MLPMLPDTAFDNLSKEEQRVLTTICTNSEMGMYVRQHQILDGLWDNDNVTTLRQVRKIVRDLRVNQGIPIVSNDKGYRIARDEDDLYEFCKGLERKAHAASASYFQTYRSMEKLLSKDRETLFDYMQ